MLNVQCAQFMVLKLADLVDRSNRRNFQIIISSMTLRVAQEVELRSGTATACGQNWNEVVNLHSFLHGGRLSLKAIVHSLVYWGDSLRK